MKSRVAKEPSARFTGEFWNHKENGKYHCVCCGTELFTSDTKYDSHCGWPSFYAHRSQRDIDSEVDRSHGMTRTEVTCSQCSDALRDTFSTTVRGRPAGALHQLGVAGLREEAGREVTKNRATTANSPATVPARPLSFSGSTAPDSSSGFASTISHRESRHGSNWAGRDW